jgi:hypothetical protein
MIGKTELDGIEVRALAARVTMPNLCRRAGKFPSSWYRAKARGRADIALIDPIERALIAVETERAMSFTSAPTGDGGGFSPFPSPDNFEK